MTPQDPRALDERIERLERLVEDLQRQLATRPPAPGTPLASPPVHPAAHGPHLPGSHPPRRSLPKLQWDGQLWLNRLGIGLVLLGTGLLFRYSIEMGWLTPTVRVLFGLAVGAVLFALGLRLDENRRFGAVLMGGGIAAWYTSGWAAFYLYGLVGYAVAFVGMVAITALAFGFALGRNAQALGVLGAIGGLGTPLLLGVTLGTPRGFALYTCVILAWTAAVHLYRGWRGLLWTAMGFGWSLLFVYARHLPPETRLAPGDRWVVTFAAVFAWAVLGVLPLARRVRRLQAAGGHERHWKHSEVAHWYALVLVPPAATLAVAAAVWNPQPEPWGYWTLAVAALYVAAGWGLYRPDHRIARALFFTASVLVSAGCVAAFGGDALLLAFAGQALALHWLAGRGGGPSIRWMAHRVFLVAAGWMLFRLVQNGDTSASRVLADLAELAVGFVASYLFRGRRTVAAYRFFVHVGLMGWLWRELAPYQGGQGLATISWGVYGLALLLYGLRASRPIVERTGIATLLAVVAKLFLVDLSALHPLFRVLLFLGFGAVFLFLSYALQGWWHAQGDEPTPARPTPR
ncbi:MAG TPA: DUF2339 domain-containing protein [Longimicrobiaceae bacterium]|nr:DUF2339 domain-containing protein [Longimicrobiaceae bacterium]